MEYVEEGNVREEMQNEVNKTNQPTKENESFVA